MLCGRRSLPTPHVFGGPSCPAKGVASVSRLAFMRLFTSGALKICSLSARATCNTGPGSHPGFRPQRRERRLGKLQPRVGHGRHRSPLPRMGYMPARFGRVSPEFNKIAGANSELYLASEADTSGLRRPRRTIACSPCDRDAA